MVARRLTGEPLAWITGRADSAACGCESIRASMSRAGTGAARRAAPPRGCPKAGSPIDLCTGSGALARRCCPARAGGWSPPTSTAAVASARANGVEAYQGDLFAPLPRELEGARRRHRRRALTCPTAELRCCSATRSPSRRRCLRRRRRRDRLPAPRGGRRPAPQRAGGALCSSLGGARPPRWTGAPTRTWRPARRRRRRARRGGD